MSKVHLKVTRIKLYLDMVHSTSQSTHQNFPDLQDLPIHTTIMKYMQFCTWTKLRTEKQDFLNTISLQQQLQTKLFFSNHTKRHCTHKYTISKSHKSLISRRRITVWPEYIILGKKRSQFSSLALEQFSGNYTHLSQHKSFQH